ncbi:MAG: LCP family protein, partial [Selenomonadales bacterium]|nr:LCP family protein [Selenomonadales bacterium]
MAVTVGGFYYLLHADFVPSAVNEDEPAIEEYMVDPIDKVNIMVLGVDRRNEDIGRSDTLFIVTADPDTKQLSMLSVPRDTRVLIPGYGYDKINHAYSLGGHKLTEKSVERLLNMPIDHYVLIDFKAFYKIIDALGGVDIYVDKRMYYEDPWDDNGGLVIDIQPGLQHMDGETAIQYVRYRDSEGDIGRVARQQKFLKAVMDRVASPSILTRIPTIIYEISSAVETDLSMGQMFSLAAMFKEAK